MIISKQVATEFFNAIVLSIIIYVRITETNGRKKYRNTAIP